MSELSLTQQQLTDLVACTKHERSFADVAFISKDAISELRHFKKLLLEHEVHDATLCLDRIGTSGASVNLSDCSLKGINLSFGGNERCELSCTVWAPLEEHALYTLGAWGSEDLFVSVESKKHGDEEPGPNAELDV